MFAGHVTKTQLPRNSTQRKWAALGALCRCPWSGGSALPWPQLVLPGGAEREQRVSTALAATSATRPDWNKGAHSIALSLSPESCRGPVGNRWEGPAGAHSACLGSDDDDSCTGVLNALTTLTEAFNGRCWPPPLFRCGNSVSGVNRLS